MVCVWSCRGSLKSWTRTEIRLISFSLFSIFCCSIRMNILERELNFLNTGTNSFVFFADNFLSLSSVVIFFLISQWDFHSAFRGVLGIFVPGVLSGIAWL